MSKLDSIDDHEGYASNPVTDAVANAQKVKAERPRRRRARAAASPPPDPTKAQLVDAAKAAGVEGVSSMNKAELAAAIDAEADSTDG